MILKRKIKSKIGFSVPFALSLFFCFTFIVGAKSEIIPCDGLDCTICSVFKLISMITHFVAFKVAIPLAGIIVAWGGIQIIISGGNEGKREAGIKALWASVIGMVITFGAWMMVNVILGALAEKSFSESWYKFPGCN